MQHQLGAVSHRGIGTQRLLADLICIALDFLGEIDEFEVELTTVALGDADDVITNSPPKENEDIWDDFYDGTLTNLFEK